MSIDYTLSIGKCVLLAYDCVSGYASHNTTFGSFSLSDFMSGYGFGRYTAFIDVSFKSSVIAFFDESDALSVIKQLSSKLVWMRIGDNLIEIGKNQWYALYILDFFSLLIVILILGTSMHHLVWILLIFINDNLFFIHLGSNRLLYIFKINIIFCFFKKFA